MNFRSHFFSIVLGILSPVLLKAQTNELGIITGYGKSTIHPYGIEMINPFSSGIDKLDVYQVGIGYYVTPAKAAVTFQYGLQYFLRSNSEIRLNNIRIPIGLEFHVGNKIRFNFGGGLYVGYLFAYQVPELYFVHMNLRFRFQNGPYLNTGWEFKFAEVYSVNLSYQVDKDINEMFIQHVSSPGGSPYTLAETGHDGFIFLTLKKSIQ